MEKIPDDSEVLGCAFNTAPKTFLSCSSSMKCFGFNIAKAYVCSAVGLSQVVLWSSAWGDDDKAMEIALRSGASAQSSAKGSGWTVLHCACQHAHKGMSAGRTVRLLIDAGADASLKDGQGRCPLHIAAGVGAAGALDTLLNHARVFAECSDGQGRTAMHWAAMSGSVECMQMLLDARCECDLRDSKGNTPLHFAACLGSAAACAFLIRNGASLETEDRWGQTPLVVAQRHHFRKDYRNTSLFAVLEGKQTPEQLDTIIRDELSKTTDNDDKSNQSLFASLSKATGSLFNDKSSSDSSDKTV